MTKKDYQIITSVIRKRYAENDYTIFAIETTNLAVDLAEAFKTDNPKFNRNRFLTACGMASLD